MNKTQCICDINLYDYCMSRNILNAKNSACYRRKWYKCFFVLGNLYRGICNENNMGSPHSMH